MDATVLTPELQDWPATCFPHCVWTNWLQYFHLHSSIVMTTFSNLLALGMMPLLLYLYCQHFPDLHTLVPYADIIIALVMILIPCGAGILFGHYRPRQARIFMAVRCTAEGYYPRRWGFRAEFSLYLSQCVAVWIVLRWTECIVMLWFRLGWGSDVLGVKKKNGSEQEAATSLQDVVDSVRQ